MKYILLIAALMMFGCNAQRLELTTVPDLDLEQYAGNWYEIARLPNSFEKGLKCITANYTLQNDGSVKVINSGFKIEEPTKQSTAIGKAKVVDANSPGKLKVSFQWPFYGKYWVLYIDENYTNAIVGTPSGKYLWILSRNDELNPEIIKDLVAKCKTFGFSTEKLIYVDHNCKSGLHSDNSAIRRNIVR
jgi:apolipoprotein D and lipocalin family protein